MPKDCIRLLTAIFLMNLHAVILGRFIDGVNFMEKCWLLFLFSLRTVHFDHWAIRSLFKMAGHFRAIWIVDFHPFRKSAVRALTISRFFSFRIVDLIGIRFAF